MREQLADMLITTERIEALVSRNVSVYLEYFIKNSLVLFHGLLFDATYSYNRVNVNDLASLSTPPQLTSTHPNSPHLRSPM